MSLGAWTALITTGCFCVLASLANGTYPPPTAVTPAEKMAMAARKVAEPVKLWKTTTRLERIVAQVNGHGVTDKVASDGLYNREKCGDDYACLPAWARGAQ